MGVSTGWGGMTRLMRLVGRATTLKLLCFLHDAVSLGLADYVLPDRYHALGKVINHSSYLFYFYVSLSDATCGLHNIV